MKQRKTIAGLCLLCALALSAFAAQGASAATKGTTLFTCKEVAAGTGHFKGAHCKPSDAGTGAGFNWDHVTVAENTTTEITGSAETTGGAFSENKFKTTIAGVAVTTSTTSVEVKGSLKNTVEAEEPNKGEHYFDGTGTITYKNVTVNVPKCKVVTDGPEGTTGEDGVIHTEELTFTSTGQGDFVKIEPVNAGKVFWHYDLANKGVEVCPIAGTYTVTGSLKAKTDGATLVFTHEETTTQNTLKLGAAKAGYDGSVTLKNKASGTPLSVTTVETP